MVGLWKGQILVGSNWLVSLGASPNKSTSLDCQKGFLVRLQAEMHSWSGGGAGGNTRGIASIGRGNGGGVAGIVTNGMS